ncbi:MAG: Cof-type HAD-IIB family hydrolase [Bacilli bacterium]|nr:Cof-type HAD-IIB family hydrolase [Bacilli bacterium]
MNRLFAFDIDGTLLPDYEVPLSENLVRSLNTLLKEGDFICISTGRPYLGAEGILDSLIDGKKYVLGVNGSIVYDKEGKVLITNTFDDEYFYELLHRFEDRDDISVYSYHPDGRITYFKTSIATELEVRVNHVKEEYAPKTCQHNQILKIIVAASKEVAATISFPKNETDTYEFTKSIPEFIEIMRKDVSKGNAIEGLRKQLGVKKEDVYCFGDGLNDVSMFERFTGIAMGNASKEVQKAAKYVTTPCAEDGVYYALKNILKVVD